MVQEQNSQQLGTESKTQEPKLSTPPSSGGAQETTPKISYIKKRKKVFDNLYEIKLESVKKEIKDRVFEIIFETVKSPVSNLTPKDIEYEFYNFSKIKLEKILEKEQKNIIQLKVGEKFLSFNFEDGTDFFIFNPFHDFSEYIKEIEQE